MRSNTTNFRNSKGQALLLVIAVMTVALALGINVSMRTLQSVSRTSKTDTSERILSAAEGGIERALKLSPGTLNGGINNATDCAFMGTNSAIDATTGECAVSFQVAGDPIVAKSLVTVSDFKYTDLTTNTYKFRVEQDSVTEVAITGVSSLKVCWAPSTVSDLYYIIYGGTPTQILAKKGLRALGSDSPSYSPTGFTDANPSGAKRYCSDNIAPPAGAKGLRIKSLGGDSKVEVISATLPAQGHKIVSSGYLLTDPATKKVITVYKSFPFLPGIFDYGIFTQSSLSY